MQFVASVIATSCPGLFPAGAGLLVEAHAKLRRALENVEQLSERQIQQREDHGGRVENRQEIIRVALHPRVAGREHQAGYADCEKQHQRQQILPKLLQCDCAVVDHATAECQHDTGDYEERRPDEPVEDRKGSERLNVELLYREPEDVCL